MQAKADPRLRHHYLPHDLAPTLSVALHHTKPADPTSAPVNHISPNTAAGARHSHGARHLLPQQDRDDEARDHTGTGQATTTRSPAQRLQLKSAVTARRARPPAAAGVLCRRGSQGHGHQEGACKGPSRRQIRYVAACSEPQPEPQLTEPVVDVADSVDISKLTAGKRVTLLSDSYKLEKLLPSSVDPLVSLMMVEKVPDSTYDMIGGLDQQIKEIKEVIELGLQHPELFESLGIAQPKGVLLYGPPGTGKTLLARAVAHHADCKFIRVSGSELVQKYIGEGSRMVRELFVMAREHAPSIIFMDEIDSIGSSRVEGSSGGDSEVQRTMLELLNQLDGFEPTKNIKIIMATNRLDILDPALLRPGRIDRKIEFPPPTVEARADILRIHSRSMNLTRGINLTKVAEKMNGCSGAELKGVCTEAGMYALRERRVHVTQEDFDLATAKVLNKHDDKATSLSKLWK